MAKLKKMNDSGSSMTRSYSLTRPWDPTLGIPMAAWLAAVIVVLAGLGAAYVWRPTGEMFNRLIVVATAVVALYVLLALKVADQWDRAVVLRLGKFHRLKGPGAFLIIPIVETI